MNIHKCHMRPKDLFIYTNRLLLKYTSIVVVYKEIFFIQVYVYISLWLPSSPAARKHIYIRNKVTYPYAYRYLCIFTLVNISLCNFTLALHHIIE